jgi:hypothetical protein
LNRKNSVKKGTFLEASKTRQKGDVPGTVKNSRPDGDTVAGEEDRDIPGETTPGTAPCHKERSDGICEPGREGAPEDISLPGTSPFHDVTRRPGKGDPSREFLRFQQRPTFDASREFLRFQQRPSFDGSSFDAFLTAAGTSLFLRWVGVLVVAAGISAAVPARAADLFLTDEPEVYAALDRLDALGVIPGFLANTRPYSIVAVRAAVEEARRAPALDEFDAELVLWLADYVSKNAMGRLEGAAAFSDDRFVPPNDQGIPVPDGWSARATFSAREETTPFASGQLRATAFRGEGDDDGTRLLDAALEVGYPYLAVQGGKLSTWYGPGRRGALIFTTNAPPVPGVRVHNQVPIPLTGRLRFLRRLDYDVFVARLGDTPPFPRSLLAGTRLAFKPRLWFAPVEIGLSRALHFGGRGSGDSLGDIFSRYFDADPDDRSNSLAGIDVAVTLPFPRQPVQLYWEGAGERRAPIFGIKEISRPDGWAHLFGIHLPRVLGLSRLGLRAEYADTYSGEAKEAAWYGDGGYPHFYRDRVLGHSMSGDSKNLFIEARYYISSTAVASLSFDRTKHEQGRVQTIVPPGEVRRRLTAGLLGWELPSWRGEVRLSAERVTNRGGVPGDDGTSFSAFVALAYQVDTLISEYVRDR